MQAIRPNFERFVARRLRSASPAMSLPTMLHRSFGAHSFRAFWRYWHPVYGYFLRYYCYLPLRRFLPDSLSLVLTFALSGFLLHDLVAWLAVGHRLFPVVTCHSCYWLA